jgi:hypothetical protein
MVGGLMKTFLMIVNICCTAILLTCLAVMLTGCGQGPKGDQGLRGAQGPEGLPGTNCSVTSMTPNSAAPNGGSLIQCPDGTSSLVLNGSNGSNGKDGQNGTNGTSGTIITSIQFCPGTPSYPSIFPEVGFCINDKIYAVYSSQGGFLTVVQPGTWVSNAIGSSCTFTVGPNCEVTN